jgi:flagellar hook-associated protein FlgK
MSSNSIGILNSALQVNKKKMDLAMQNIANADNENYSQKVIDTSAVVIVNSGQGVKINGIRNSSNELLQRNLLNANSSANSLSYISKKRKEFTDKLSLPGSDEGIYNKLSLFLDAIDTLAVNPMDPSMRNDINDKANDLSKYISEFARYLQDQRHEADKAINSSFNSINRIVANIHEANAKQMLYSEDSLKYAQIQDDINADLKKLSEYFDINFSKDASGVLHVYLRNGGQEIVGKLKYHFEYEPAKTVDDFIEENDLNPVYLVAQSIDGREESKNIFIKSAKSSDMSYNLSAGSIDGLLQMRDNIIPKVGETIDEFAVKVASVFNEIHNKGNGSRPLSILTGSVALTGSDRILGNGEIIINPMGSDGRPMISGAYGEIPALALDLSEFTTNNLGGSFTNRGLVNAINQYFQAAAHSRVNIDGFHTINLGIQTIDASNITVDFDVIAYDQNPATQNMQLKVKSVVVNGSSIAMPINDSITVDNTKHIRTGINGGPSIIIPKSSGPMNVEIGIETTVDGITKTSTVQYIINNSTSINQILPPVAVTGDGSILNGSGYQVVKASIVDSHGIEIFDDSKVGFLKIENTQKNGTVAIDSANSNLISLDNAKVEGSFSSAFGLNDVFSFKNGQKYVSILDDDNIKPSKNVAVYMQLNNSIKESTNAFSVGKIAKYRGGLTNFDSPTIFFSAGVGDTSLVSEYQKLKTKNVSFNNTADIPSQSSTICDYSVYIASVNNIRAISDDVSAKRYTQLKEALANQLISETSVNVDDIAIQTMQYQKSYTMAAKFINTTNNLLQTLIDSI